MAIWNIDTFDSVADPLRSKFPAPYVEGLPQGVVRDGPQNNPFEGTASILGTYNTGANNSTGNGNKYMHYCTRMLRWNDIDVSDIPNIGTRSTCHKTSRFGDLRDMLGHGNDGDRGKSNKTKISVNYNINDEMTRYRFNPITRVKYYQYTRKGMRYSEELLDGTDLSGSSAGNHPFSGLTCGWSPGSTDNSFHWNPNSTELTQISTDIASDLSTKGTTLAKLQALDYTWNLCIIAWCWAGYRRAGNFGDGQKEYQGLQVRQNGEQRDVDEVDIYYFPFIF
tara:strand:- start:344 stop:1183 length:840 start_codon:yes stop_codon:yes gene_type:complete